MLPTAKCVSVNPSGQQGMKLTEFEVDRCSAVHPNVRDSAAVSPGREKERKTLTMTEYQYGTKSLFSNGSVNIWGKWTFTSTCSLTKGFRRKALLFKDSHYTTGVIAGGCSSFSNTWETVSLLVGAPRKIPSRNLFSIVGVFDPRHIRGVKAVWPKVSQSIFRTEKEQSL